MQLLHPQPSRGRPASEYATGAKLALPIAAAIGVIGVLFGYLATRAVADRPVHRAVHTAHRAARLRGRRRARARLPLRALLAAASTLRHSVATPVAAIASPFWARPTSSPFARRRADFSSLGWAGSTRAYFT